MKTSTAVIAGVLALAVIGGGTAYAMTTADDQPTAVVQTETPTPEADQPTPETTESAAPEEAPAPEPTEPVQTPTPEPTPVATEPPAPTEPTYTGKEGEFVTWAGEHVRGYGLNITDAELLAYGYGVCDQIREAGMASPGMIFIPELTASVNAGFGSIAITVLCPEFA